MADYRGEAILQMIAALKEADAGETTQLTSGRFSAHLTLWDNAALVAPWVS
jgi:hypothetical protein